MNTNGSSKKQKSSRKYNKRTHPEQQTQSASDLPNIFASQGSEEELLAQDQDQDARRLSIIVSNVNHTSSRPNSGLANANANANANADSDANNSLMSLNNADSVNLAEGMETPSDDVESGNVSPQSPVQDDTANFEVPVVNDSFFLKENMNKHALINIISALEKSVAMIGFLLLMVNTAASLSKSKSSDDDHHSLINNNIIQAVTSLLPLILVNIIGTAILLWHIIESKNLLKEYQEAYKDNNLETILIKRYATLVNLATEIVFPDTAFAAQLEPHYLENFQHEHITPQQLKAYYTAMEMNLSDRDLYTHSFIFTAGIGIFLILNLVAASDIYLGKYFLKSTNTQDIFKLVSVIFLLFLIIPSHFLEHSVRFLPETLIEKIKKALDAVSDIEKGFQKSMQNLLKTLSFDERKKVIEEMNSHVEKTSEKWNNILTSKPSLRKWASQKIHAIDNSSDEETDEAISLKLSLPGLVLQPTKSQGNGLYAAIALCLEEKENVARKNIADKFLEKVDTYKAKIKLQEHQTFEDYVRGIRKGQSGDNLNMEFIASILERYIVIVNDKGEINYTEQDSQEPIFIYYDTKKNHYDALLRINPQTTAQDILNQISKLQNAPVMEMSIFRLKGLFFGIKEMAILPQEFYAPGNKLNVLQTSVEKKKDDIKQECIFYFETHFNNLAKQHINIGTSYEQFDKIQDSLQALAHYLSENDGLKEVKHQVETMKKEVIKLVAHMKSGERMLKQDFQEPINQLNTLKSLLDTHQAQIKQAVTAEFETHMKHLMRQNINQYTTLDQLKGISQALNRIGRMIPPTQDEDIMDIEKNIKNVMEDIIKLSLRIEDYNDVHNKLKMAQQTMQKRVL